MSSQQPNPILENAAFDFLEQYWCSFLDWDMSRYTYNSEAKMIGYLLNNNLLTIAKENDKVVVLRITNKGKALMMLQGKGDYDAVSIC